MRANQTIWKIAVMALVAIVSLWVSAPQQPCCCAFSHNISESAGDRHGEGCCQSEETAKAYGLQTNSCYCDDLRTAFLPSTGLKINTEPFQVKLALTGYGIKEISCWYEAFGAIFSRNRETQNDCLKLAKIFILNRSLLI